MSGTEQLDTHTREIVQWHFDPQTGCPFWLDYAQRLGWDPRQHVHTYDDLDKFPPFQDEWLRGGPVRRWVPKGLAGRPVYVFETGGSTGVPKSRINIEDFRIDYEMFSDTLSDEHFPRGADWLMLGPSGPRRLRLAVEHLAQHRGGISFCVDMDPRWVTRLVKAGRMNEMHEYKDHVVNQGLTLLRAHDNIRCVFTTPKLLEALCERVSLVKASIRGVFCGGTQLTRQFHRFAREELLENGPLKAGESPQIDFVPTYGNTLMGLACHKPFDPADNYCVIYHPPCPRALIEVVDMNSTDDPDTWYKPPTGAKPGTPTEPRPPKSEPRPSHTEPRPSKSEPRPSGSGCEEARPTSRSAPGQAGQRHRLVDYNEVGRVRLTTLTREFFMPRFLERDEGLRLPPCDAYPWDGVGDVRPFSGFAVPIVEGVY